MNALELGFRLELLVVKNYQLDVNQSYLSGVCSWKDIFKSLISFVTTLLSMIDVGIEFRFRFSMVLAKEGLDLEGIFYYWLGRLN